MRHLTVRVVNSGGHPIKGTRVSVGIHGIDAGVFDPQYTDQEGATEFKLNVSDYAKVTIYVNGKERVKNESLKSDYVITA